MGCRCSGRSRHRPRWQGRCLRHFRAGRSRPQLNPQHHRARSGQRRCGNQGNSPFRQRQGDPAGPRFWLDVRQRRSFGFGRCPGEEHHLPAPRTLPHVRHDPVVGLRRQIAQHLGELTCGELARSTSARGVICQSFWHRCNFRLLILRRCSGSAPSPVEGLIVENQQLHAHSCPPVSTSNSRWSSSSDPKSISS